MMKHIRRSLSLLLALCMALSVFTACTGKKNPPDETTVTDPATDPTTDPATNPVTDPETIPDEPLPPDPAEGYLLLAGESVDAPVQILLPDYPALWETAAAEALQTQILSLSGVEVSVIGKGNEAADGHPALRIGPDSRVSATEIGNAGYHVSVDDGGILLYAESENGMADALAALARSMTVINGALAVSRSLSETVKKETAPQETVELSGTWGDSIAYAGSLVNQLNGAFTSGSRAGYILSNSTMKLVYDLHSIGNKQVAGFYNANGVPYFTDSMDVFLTTTDGETVWASNSQIAGRVNTYRLGYYYRDIHVLDQNFSAGEMTFDESNVKKLIKKGTSWSGNMVSEIEKVGTDGAIRYTVADSTDPYISGSINFDTKKFNAIKVVIRNDTATSGEVYLNNGKGYNAGQKVKFQLTPGEEFRTYIILLNTIENYTQGNVVALRFDIGAVNGETVEIAELYAVNVDAETLPICLDRTFHTYSDKLHEQLHFVCTGKVTALGSYGMQTVIDASRVQGICIIDKNGRHDSLTDVDWASAEAAAFDVKRAGVVGWILAAGSTDALTVEKTDGKYIIRIEHFELETQSYEMYDQFSIGYRLYNDESHSFDAFATEAYIERNPIEIRLFQETDSAQAIGYNALRGCYEYTVKGVDFTTGYRNPQRQYKVCADIVGDDVERKLYIMTHEKVGCLENVVVLDDNDLLLPISPEVTKNFGHEKEEPIFDRGDTTYGEGIFPLVLAAGEERQFTVLHLYQNWGLFPLKQLSSIQFISPYYHLSCGVTETNCIAPYYVYGKDFWTLPDFRAMSAPLWASQPQHTSVGRLYWLQYTDSEGKKYGSDFLDDSIVSSGPVYADIIMDYLSDDGRIAATYRHLETPQTDENRTYYEVDFTVLEDLTIRNFAEDFSCFYFDGCSVAL